jgi:putative pyruvate formate lyase activating enzyme
MVNRLHGERGRCRVGRLAQITSAAPHYGEEDCLIGWRGSGTIFFAGCSLGCAFCQNWDTSHEVHGEPVTAEQLARMMLRLQEEECHNLNLVTPTHVVPQILEALALAVPKGFRLPIVYNSSGYELISTLSLLDGVVDIYMPDFKFWDASTAQRLTGARDYPEATRLAIQEMHRQVGDLDLGESGLAQRGLLLRHLVLPNGLAGTSPIMEWLANEISPDTYVNLMSQYRPEGEVLNLSARSTFADLCRATTGQEMSEACQAAHKAGIWRLETASPPPPDPNWP